MVALGEVVLEATDIEKYFGRVHVLHGVSLAVRQHETVMLIGRSGSGKTTFLRCLNFLEEPTAGSVIVGDLRIDADPLQKGGRKRRGDIRQLRQQTGMLFQEFNLFPHMSVLDNCIEAPIHVKGVSKDEAVATAEKYLEKVQMVDKRDEFPARMSGGQKQRAAIARALCMEPEVLLFDEPTSALDPELIGEVVVVIEQLAHEGTTMIVVSHEMAFAREAADRVLYIEGGVVVEEGPPEQVLDDPQEEATKQFLRRFLSEGARAPTADDPNPPSPFSGGTPKPDPLVGRSGGGGTRHGHGGGG
ncbi:MAG: amino acid ABC transporter ATP-binding protein [Chloroflexota bacterium]|nr:amino acid ABC transporter ATP-binding protein [Chloroflexota bacterium]